MKTTKVIYWVATVLLSALLVISAGMYVFNNEMIQNEQLTIPHPHLQDRNFVLLPFCEIAPEWMHPVSLKSMRILLEECSDELEVQQLELSEK